MSDQTQAHIDRMKNARELEENFVTELRNEKRRQRLSLILLNLLGIVLFLLAWEILPRVVPNVNILMFPPPSSVVEVLIPLVTSGELASNIYISLQRADGRVCAGNGIGHCGWSSDRPHSRVAAHYGSRPARIPIGTGDRTRTVVADLVRHR